MQTFVLYQCQDSYVEMPADLKVVANIDSWNRKISEFLGKELSNRGEKIGMLMQVAGCCKL